MFDTFPKNTKHLEKTKKQKSKTKTQIKKRKQDYGTCPGLGRGVVFFLVCVFFGFLEVFAFLWKSAKQPRENQKNQTLSAVLT